MLIGAYGHTDPVTSPLTVCRTRASDSSTVYDVACVTNNFDWLIDCRTRLSTIGHQTFLVQLLPLTPATGCLSTLLRHPFYQSTKHLWRPVSSRSPFHDCKMHHTTYWALQLFIHYHKCQW